MSPQLSRAQLLLHQGRFDMAEKELGAAIGQSPEDPIAHAMLGACLAELGRKNDAVAASQRAIALGPDLSYCHYVMACVFEKIGRIDSALSAIDQAVELDPADPDTHARRGEILLHKHRWSDALDSAEHALSIDAEHVDAANIRAVALTKLGRRDEAGATIDAALQRDPENPTSHANMGWTCLHGGQARQAAEHFREALRIDPDNEWARAGIVEALKARNIIYRLFLRHILWMSGLQPSTRFALVIGAIIIIQLLLRLPEGGPVFWIGVALAIAYMLVVLTVWTAMPLFNLLLRLDRFGRWALTDDQRRDSTWMGLALLSIGAMVVITVVSGIRVADVIDYMLLSLAAGVALTVPRTARRRPAALITIGLFILAAIHCYRWRIGPLPLEIDALHDPQQFLARALAEDDFDAQRVVAFARSQQTINNIFVWGTIAMTWFALAFHKPKRAK